MPTLLFTSLFTIVLSINETNQNYQFRSVGTYAHGSFKDVVEAQISTLSAHPKVKAAGQRTVIGICTSGAFEKDYGEVSFMDENTAKWGYAVPTAGRTPAGGKEIAMDTKALALLGVAPELGAEVTLTYSLTDKNQLGRDVTDIFTLVGWWEFDELMGVHFLNVSRDYADQIEAMAMEEGMESFRTDLNVMLRSSLDIENTTRKVASISSSPATSIPLTGEATSMRTMPCCVLLTGSLMMPRCSPLRARVSGVRSWKPLLCKPAELKNGCISVVFHQHAAVFDVNITIFNPIMGYKKWARCKMR